MGEPPELAERQGESDPQEDRVERAETHGQWFLVQQPQRAGHDVDRSAEVSDGVVDHAEHVAQLDLGFAVADLDRDVEGASP